MRSRFNHDGSLDYHAHNEHEIFRRADEALERQRLQDHAARAGEPLGVTLVPFRRPSTTPLGSSQIATHSVPTMPHQEIAQRLLKPTQPATLFAHKSKP